jgi:hypothetical protein
MKPPTFAKAEDPLEAEAWVKAIEAKFSAFVLPCSEENKANFTALQLRGEALMWWDHFKSMQRGHAVTWEEFKQAFKSHHIPKGLMDRKMRELLALRQGLTPCTAMLRNSIAYASTVGIMLILMPRRWRGSMTGLMASCMSA